MHDHELARVPTARGGPPDGLRRNVEARPPQAHVQHARSETPARSRFAYSAASNQNWSVLRATRRERRPIEHLGRTGVVPTPNWGGRANQGLDLTIPDAAQSVPVGPLCLLSGLAAQCHVGLTGSPCY